MTQKTPPVTILVVDDDPSMLMLAAQTLRRDGYYVLCAGDSAQALHVSEQYESDINLLLVDIVLPAGNGIALANDLLAKRPGTPVLYMSGFDAEAIRAVQHEGGPNGEFLQKPFAPRVLVERVRAIAPLKDRNRRDSEDAHGASMPAAVESVQDPSSDAVYRLETPVRCPQCGNSISTLKAVRLLRTQVNFTSTLPRRGRVITCPACATIVSAELTSL